MTAHHDACPEAASHGRPFRYCPVKGCGWMEPRPERATATFDADRLRTLAQEAVGLGGRLVNEGTGALAVAYEDALEAFRAEATPEVVLAMLDRLAVLALDVDALNPRHT